MIFSSRTLADRNNDPYPNVWDGHSPRDQMRTDTDMFRKGAPSSLKGYSRKPRPEFQHGVLPENPILVAFRGGSVSAKSLLKAINTGNADSPAGKMLQRSASVGLGGFRVVPFDDDWTLKGGYGGSAKRSEVEKFAFSRINHAHRVLTLLSKLTPDN